MFSTLLIDWLSLMRLLFYKMIIVCAGQLILPECMKLLPLYTNCLLKSGMKAVVTSSTPITLKQWCRSGSAWRMRIRTKELIIVRNDGERAESDEIPTPDLSAWSAACQHHSVMLLILQVVFFLQSFVCQDVKKKFILFTILSPQIAESCTPVRRYLWIRVRMVPNADPDIWLFYFWEPYS